MTLPFVREFFRRLGGQLPVPSMAAVCAEGRRLGIGGLTPPAQLLTAALLQRVTRRPVLLIVPDNRTAEEWRETLATFQELTGPVKEDERPLILPAFEIDPYEGLSPHAEILEQRALALWRFGQGAPFLIVPAVAAATWLPAPESFRTLARTVRKGDLLDLDGLAEHLQLVGYERADPVETSGQYSIRGGLLDVFSPEAAHPIRVELFGDEVESLREFDLETQRSIRPVDHALMLPLTALPLTTERAARLRAAAGGSDEPLSQGWEFLIPGLEGFQHSVLDLQPEALVLVSEPELVAAHLERWERRLRDRHAQARRRAEEAPGKPAPVPEPESIFLREEELRRRLAAAPGADLRELFVQEIDLTAETLELVGQARGAASTLSVASRPAPRYQGDLRRMVDDLRQQLERGMRLVFLVGSLGEVERLADLFQEYGLPFQVGSRREGESDYLTEKSQLGTEAVHNVIVSGNLLRGFSLPELQVTIFAASDIFQDDDAAHRAMAAPARRKSRTSTFLSDFRDLAPGDFVVHLEYGIGQYVGLQRVDGEVRPAKGAAGDGGLTGAEFMVIEYADRAKLYVPLTRMDLVQKYRSAEGARPTLDRLGGTGWQARKARVKKAMKDMADELLQLYAARQAVAIEPCGPDGHWQREFEDAFPYTETEDQARAIEDVRRDLQKGRPMDRLVVGDVGYGKTEVAMRAAFRVVQAGRQAAILAPTTVLAFQHFETLKERFRAFPVTIAMLSRFRSAAQQRETVEQIEAGKVDIVVGTHRLLSKDVQFRNLGILIVDEEQRFGVRHKERLKQLKKEVHVLALSATPIPRTLNMSLAGIRDLSVIETPPKDRLAIQTVVAPFQEELIQAAIENELGRGGQLYFVHNRVDSIWEIASFLQRLAPSARIAVGHGQMREDELEKVMMRFVRREADILVSTTIIENGLDIPLANTIIINRADHLGLGELYQLRGRVGRSNRRAYAYLLVPPEAELTPIARKRLAAMREFSDLGAGFKIAALDLELRGAGNLLGGEQSGQIDSVGFDLYVRMLEQAVRELKGEEIEPEQDVQIQLGLDVRIPPEYIAEENQRLRMYKRVAEAEAEREREDVLRELQDRYGAVPLPVHNLLAYSAFKARCRRLGIQMLERKRDQLWLRFSEQAGVNPDKIATLIEQARGAQFTPQGVLKLPFLVNGSAPVLQAVERLLGALTSEAPVGRN